MHILQNVSFSEEDLIKKSKNLKPPDGKPFLCVILDRASCTFPSDDSWLQISPQELEAMMKKAAGYLPPDIGAPSSQQNKAAASEFKEEEGSTGSEELDLQSMVYGMKSFVDKVSSHEGAEFPWYEHKCTCMRSLIILFRLMH